MLREVKTNPYKVLKTFIISNKELICIKTNKFKNIKPTELSISDRYSTGNSISKKEIVDAFIIKNTENKDSFNVEEHEEIEVNKSKKISLEEIDDRLMTIDDFLK